MLTTLIKTSRRTSTLLSLILVPLSLVGCRTYGDYGANEKTLAEIERVNEQFARNLARAQVDESTLSDAAVGNSSLTSLAEEYAQIVADHEEYVGKHSEELADLKAGFAGYRAISRLFGSIITDQHAIANRYRHVAAELREVRGGEAVTLRAPDTYQQVPPFYLRIEYHSMEESVGDVLRAGL